MQRTSGPVYQFQESTTLSEAAWPASVVTPVTDGNQAGVPINYVRKQATLPVNAGSKFFRVVGVE